MIKNGLKKKLAAFSALLVFMITGSLTGTSAYFSDSKEGTGLITTGNYVNHSLFDGNMKIYASVGPLFEGAHGFDVDYQSPSYPKWLENASNYICEDLKTGKAPDVPHAHGETPDVFKDIQSGSRISRTLDICSSDYNWNGNSKYYCGEEKGNIVHFVVALENTKRTGDDTAAPLRARSLDLAITQNDFFKSIKSAKKEYAVKRDAKQLNPSQNMSRVKAFKWENNAYALIENATADTAADMLVFDIGSKGYFSHSESILISEQFALDHLNGMLCAAEPHGYYGLLEGFHTTWDGAMYDVVVNQMKGKNLKDDDLYCKLDRMECSVDFTYEGKKVPGKKKVVQFTEASKESSVKMTSNSAKPLENSSDEVESKIKTK